MKIHHLNCGTINPPGGPLADGVSPWYRRGRAVCHCLLLETATGLVLVDTGIGTHTIEKPTGSTERWFVRGLHPSLDPRETALAQITALGFSANDVRHVVLTHLDVDHVGGLPDFPNASVHLSSNEFDALQHPRTWFERRRYLNQPALAHNPRWVPHADDGDTWMGFDGTQQIAGLDGIVLVPLYGHTVGHIGVAIAKDSAAGSKWLLHGGDSFSYHGQLETPARYPLGLKAFDNALQADKTLRLQNIERLRELAIRGDVDIFAAHDAHAFDRLTSTAPAHEPESNTHRDGQKKL
ncbi:MBL fold metallo-hydrolase [Rhodococcus erythropolis]|uniref:MBL fold metallo-hydrolase n=1 Tax=Rhodococcus erythropolis TaxID=1833 RepID=UPI001E3C0867|nr:MULTISPECIES: MBL fold metallo-hydrolase [Rhodococcus erythropolis group]MCD2109412.1 MBL fold metallo-hydrolase [Rhodococcus qingshengii]MCZ4527403.1 MBL fold metallo-hydrolase [Rhodococcus erythropolis]